MAAMPQCHGDDGGGGSVKNSAVGFFTSMGEAPDQYSPHNKLANKLYCACGSQKRPK